MPFKIKMEMLTMRIKLNRYAKWRIQESKTNRIKIGDFEGYLKPFEKIVNFLDFVFYNENDKEAIIIFDNGQNQIKLIIDQMTEKTFETFKETVTNVLLVNLKKELL